MEEKRERKKKRNTSGRAINQYARERKRRKKEANRIEKEKGNRTWKEARRNYDGIQYKPRGKRPEGLQNDDTEVKMPKDIRVRLKILALNVRSILANKKMLERYANDNEAHVLVITETNITVKDMEKAQIAKFAIAGYSCRKDQNTRGGGGGGCSSTSTSTCPLSQASEGSRKKRGS